MGKLSRDKGARVERAIVSALQGHGIAAERVPLSGMGADRRGSTRFKADVSVPVLGNDERVEVKARKDGFRELYAWLDDNFALVVKADRKDPLVVLRMEDAARILMVAEGRKGDL